MKLTKYGHACVIIENNKKRLIIDPGDFTELPEDVANIEAIVLTHEHGDHTDPTNVAIIHAYNPDVVIYGTQGSIDHLEAIDCKKVVVDGPLEIDLISSKVVLEPTDHAIIWQTSPCKNLTVTVGDFFYYPGDSFAVCSKPVKIVGVPVSGPWLKTSESLQFALDAHAELLLPTHNGLLNTMGHEIVHNWFVRVFDGTDKKLLLLQNGEEYQG